MLVTVIEKVRISCGGKWANSPLCRPSKRESWAEYPEKSASFPELYSERFYASSGKVP